MAKKKTEQVSSFVMLHANLNQVLFFSIGCMFFLSVINSFDIMYLL